MSRQHRIQFAGAIYHVTSRGNRRQDIVHDDRDRQQWWQRLGEAVGRYGWEMFAAVLMTNHFHLFFRTPQPNLSRGMQWLLGGYATWWNTRHQRVGHVFQGRFQAQLVEDETYFWTVSRYVHRNPVPVLVDHPADWRWSTYGGYAGRQPRLPWVQYDALLDAWSGQFGGQRSAEAYCRFVEADLSQRVASPFVAAEDGWILGSKRFVARVRKLISPRRRDPQNRRKRNLPSLELDQVVDAVCQHYGWRSGDLATKGSRHQARLVLAVLARRHTAATLAQVATALGLARRDCVPNLLRRTDRLAALAPEIGAVERLLLDRL